MGRLSAPESGWKFEGSISPSTALEDLEEVLYKTDKDTVIEETRVLSCRHSLKGISQAINSAVGHLESINDILKANLNGDDSQLAMAIRDSDGFGNRNIKICIIVSDPDVSHLMLQRKRVRLSTKDMVLITSHKL